ncbi:SPL family radical SAM protein [Crocinitomix algicola]|uniref:SPL family radical SAM protein n=1 Tax=Crocinitomix algicola TaxID=1740263 RepID=UPI00082AEBA0|nr:radical SAM protein [Crocinitomix algicola]
MLREKEVKSVLNKTKQRDSWFLDDYTLNLYSSCSFNCLYCYIRGSKYGVNLAEKLTRKVNSLAVLDRQLFNRAKKKQYGFIVLSSATDPYLDVDEHIQLTREALKIILKYKFPVHIITKSHNVLRDVDLLREIHHTAVLPTDLDGKLNGGTIVSFSFSTLDDEVAKIFESGANPPSQRLKALAQITEESFKTGVSLMPLLPFISDTKEALDEFYLTFSKLKVDYILPATITLFGQNKGDSKTLVLRAIEKHYPHLYKRYLNYFAFSSELPLYYRLAFDNKMKELHQQYQIKRSII